MEYQRNQSNFVNNGNQDGYQRREFRYMNEDINGEKHNVNVGNDEKFAFLNDGRFMNDAKQVRAAICNSLEQKGSFVKCLKISENPQKESQQT